jgi:hypothetical protein
MIPVAYEPVVVEGEARRLLYTALILAFPCRSMVWELVAIPIGPQRFELPSGEVVIATVVFQLLEWGDAYGCLGNVMTVAGQLRPDNAELLAVLASVRLGRPPPADVTNAIASPPALFDERTWMAMVEDLYPVLREEDMRLRAHLPGRDALITPMVARLELTEKLRAIWGARGAVRRIERARRRHLPMALMQTFPQPEMFADLVNQMHPTFDERVMLLGTRGLEEGISQLVDWAADRHRLEELGRAIRYLRPKHQELAGIVEAILSGDVPDSRQVDAILHPSQPFDPSDHAAIAYLYTYLRINDGEFSRFLSAWSSSTDPEAAASRLGRLVHAVLGEQMTREVVEAAIQQDRRFSLLAFRQWLWRVFGRGERRFMAVLLFATALMAAFAALGVSKVWAAVAWVSLASIVVGLGATYQLTQGVLGTGRAVGVWASGKASAASHAALVLAMVALGLGAGTGDLPPLGPIPPPPPPDAAPDDRPVSDGSRIDAGLVGPEDGGDEVVDIGPLDCPPGYANCDGNPANGCETSLRSNPRHCGACGRRCTFPHGVAACRYGECTLDRCEDPYGDCDTSRTNGCEVDLSRANDHCGSCRHPCASPNARLTCVDRVCVLDTCEPGFADCRRDDGVQCETNTSTDPSNCGGCDRVCAAPNAIMRCNGGGCEIQACVGAFADCDGRVENGCEVDTASDTLNCGRCANRCAARPQQEVRCEGGVCGAACLEGWQSCNGPMEDTDGCETHVAGDTQNCGRCANRCVVRPQQVTQCEGGACRATCLAGWRSCNGPADSADGCETHVAIDERNCGVCGNVCAAPRTGEGLPYCSNAACGVRCPEGFTNCDGRADNGCEEPVGTDRNCGGACGRCEGGRHCDGGVCVASPPADAVVP